MLAGERRTAQSSLPAGSPLRTRLFRRTTQGSELSEDAPTERITHYQKLAPDSASRLPPVMHNQGRLTIRCATLNRMQRVALLM